MKPAIFAPAAIVIAVLAGCASYEPTEAEIEARNRELLEHCQDLLEEVERLGREDKLIRRATTQEQYNRECLGRTTPDPGGGQ